jgi:Secretion system C-terminal sorting domain/N-terminal domain of BNR-repeat neuraminidase
MKIFTRFILFLGVLAMGFLNRLDAQCPFVGTLYGTAAAPTTCTPAYASPTCHYASSSSGDYASFTALVAGTTYTIRTSNTSGSIVPNTDQLTIYLSTNTTTGNHVAFGTGGSVTFTPTASGTYYVIITPASSSCGTVSSVCRYPSIQCTSCPPAAASTTQPSTTGVTGGTINNQILRLNVPACSAQTVTSINLATTGSTNPTTDIANAKVYFTTTTTFSTTTQFGSTVVDPNGAFTVTGSQAIAANTTGYFHLVYDLKCGAVGGNVIDAECTSYENGVTNTLATPNPAGTRSITAASTTLTTTQPSTATVAAGSVNNQVLRVQVTSCANSVVTDLNLSTTGSTNPATDITNAKVYFTTTTTFSTTVQFGSTVTGPNGNFAVTGSQVLTTGTGYFWLTYDVPSTATGGNVLDASCVNVVKDGTTFTPATPNPTGTRTIFIPPTCPGGLGSPVTASLPYNSGTGITTCGNVNNVTSTNATICGSSNYYGGEDRTYIFTPTATGTHNIVLTTTTDDDAGIQLYNGCPFLGGGTCVAFSQASTGLTRTISTSLTSGTTYYLVVDNWTAPACIASYQLTIGLQPSSDACTEATTLAANSSVGGTTIGATTDSGFAACSNGGGTPACPTTGTGTNDVGGAGVWYKYTSTESETVTVSTSGADFDLEIQVFSGSCVALTCIGGSDGTGNDATFCWGSTANFAPVTYFIYVDGNGAAVGNFVLSLATGALPVELISFEGTALEKENKLTWATASEENTEWHILERSINGQNNWTEIGRTRAAGTTAEIQRYEMMDKAPVASAYYRLQSLDFDARFEYSKVIQIERKGGVGDMSIYPNPVSNDLNVDFTLDRAEEVTIQIVDLTGKLLSSEVMDAERGLNQRSMNVQHLHSGVYFVTMISTNGNVTKRLVKY